MQASVKFRIQSWDEEPFDEPEDGPKMTRAQIRKSFAGDLVATGNLMYVMTYLEGGGAVFSGFERILGSLGGRSGSFVLQHTGAWDGEKARANCEVVPGSGTEELAGLSGSGEFSAGHAEEHDMAFEYEL